MRRLGYYLITVFALHPGVARAQIAAPVQYDAVTTPAPVDSKGIAHEVAIHADQSDRITVKVMIGGRGPYDFLVDTGADHTVIGSHIAGSLKLTRADRMRIFTVAGNQNVNTASVEKLQFSSKTLVNINAAVLDRKNLGADGVLGIDSLRSERVTFDFRKGLMTIVPSSKAETRVPNRDTVVVTGKLRAGRLVLTEARAANKRVSVVIDTGAETTVDNRELQRRLFGSKLVHAVGPVRLESVTGHVVAAEMVMIEKLSVGGVIIENLNIVFADAPIFKVLKLDNRPALLLGMNAIRAFDRVSIDFANRKFRVVLPETGEITQVRLAAR